MCEEMNHTVVSKEVGAVVLMVSERRLREIELEVCSEK